MNLQLAESAGLTAGPVSTKPYIFIPGRERGKGTYVREDLLDAIPNNQYSVLMKQLAPHQREVQNGMSEDEYLSNKATRKAKRATKAADKHEKKAAKSALKRAKGEAKVTRAKSGKGRKAAADALEFGKSLVKSKVGGGSGGGGGGDDTPKDPWYKTTGGMVAIGVGGLALVTALGYGLTRKKKK